MLLGRYKLSFSGHNRITLPKSIRESVGRENKVVLMVGDGCIWGFGWKDFEIEAQKRLEKSVWEEEGRIERRQFFIAAVECELDEHNRLVVPGELLEKAKINEEMVLIGAGDHFEIWNSKELEKELKKNG